MIRTNEKRMNYVSSYSDEVYTTHLDKSAPDYAVRAMRAEAIAQDMRLQDILRKGKGSGQKDNGYEQLSEADKYSNVNPLKNGGHNKGGRGAMDEALPLPSP